MRQQIAMLFAVVFVLWIARTNADEVEGDAEPFDRVLKLNIEKPGGLAHDGKLFWVTDRNARKLKAFELASGKIVKEIEAPGLMPTGLAYDGKLLWVADRNKNKLFAVDLARELVVKEISAPENPLGLAFDGQYLWVADGRQIHQVTREDGTTITSFNAPTYGGSGRGGDQQGLAYDGGYLWVSDRTTDRLYKVAPQNGDVVDIVDSKDPFPAGLAVANGKLYVVDVDRQYLNALSHSALPRIVRAEPQKEQVVLKRTVINRGPGVVEEANIYVAIPHSAPNQAIDGEPKFSPPPQEIVEDQWGQKFAHLKVGKLGPGQSAEIKMTTELTLFSIRHHVDPAKVGSLNSIPKNIRAKYLKDGSKFAIHHPSIRKHVQEALGGEKHPYWMVRKIARYIQDKMYYELAGGWNIAPTVIDRGSGSCSEYSFVFISMCRAAGIPARYVGAVVVRGDNASTDEVFHRWPEVYFPGYGWVPTDAQAGDKPEPEQQGLAMGSLGPRFLITTWGGGDSKYIGWDYNSTASWTCKGRCDVVDLHVGDWYAADRGPDKP